MIVKRLKVFVVKTSKHPCDCVLSYTSIFEERSSGDVILVCLGHSVGSD